MVPQWSVADVKRRLDAGEPLLLLDVREPWEYALAHLPGSTLIPLGELAGRAHEVEAPAGGAVVVVCHHGVRSLKAAIYLKHVGVGAVASMAGGTDAWSRDVDPALPRY